MIVRELVPLRDEQVEYVRGLQDAVSRAQVALDAACKGMVVGAAPDDCRVVGGMTEGYLIVEYPWECDAPPS